MLEAFSSKIEKIVQEAKKTNRIVVFLGGTCKDPSWREGLQKDFGDRLFFIDPYDKDWDAKDNIYDELAGMINSDYIVFYRGGELTDREKDFLENIDRKDDSVKQFEDIDKLRAFLKSIKGKKKLASVSVVLREYAGSLYKEAWAHTRNKGDLHLENMPVKEDRKSVV